MSDLRYGATPRKIKERVHEERRTKTSSNSVCLLMVSKSSKPTIKVEDLRQRHYL